MKVEEITLDPQEIFSAIVALEAHIGFIKNIKAQHDAAGERYDTPLQFAVDDLSNVKAFCQKLRYILKTVEMELQKDEQSNTRH